MPSLVQDAVTATVNAASLQFSGLIRVSVPRDAPDSLPAAEYLRVAGVRNRDKSYSETLESFDPRKPSRLLEKDRIRAVRTRSGFAVYFEQAGRWSRVSGLGASADPRFTHLTAGVSTSPNAVLGFLGALRGHVKMKMKLAEHSTRYTLNADLESMAKNEPSTIRASDLRGVELSRSGRAVVDLQVKNQMISRVTRRSHLQYPGPHVVTTYSDFFFARRATESIVRSPRLG